MIKGNIQRVTRLESPLQCGFAPIPKSPDPSRAQVALDSVVIAGPALCDHMPSSPRRQRGYEPANTDVALGTSLMSAEDGATVTPHLSAAGERAAPAPTAGPGAANASGGGGGGGGGGDVDTPAAASAASAAAAGAAAAGGSIGRGGEVAAFAGADADAAAAAGGNGRGAAATLLSPGARRAVARRGIAAKQLQGFGTCTLVLSAFMCLVRPLARSLRRGGGAVRALVPPRLTSAF